MTRSGPEAARAIGVSYRMLDYWLRTGITADLPIADRSHPSPGSGYGRRITEAEFERLRAVARLVEAGVSLQRIRGILVRFGSLAPLLEDLSDVLGEFSLRKVPA